VLALLTLAKVEDAFALLRNFENTLPLFYAVLKGVPKVLVTTFLLKVSVIKE
jgi:hypothetical protein